MFYDLHIHSALSPCGDDSMTINNIINMAMIKELDLIAITDHNSLKQQTYLKQISQDKVQIIYGVELQTREEIHVLGYFREENRLPDMQKWIDQHLQVILNKPEFFGNQLIFDQNDEVISHEERLLLSSLDTSLEETVDAIHQHHGIVVLAHVLDKRYSVFENLGFIPPDLEIEGIEVKSDEQIDIVKKRTPYLKNIPFFRNSDAHQLIDISEPIHSMTQTQFEELWR